MEDYEYPDDKEEWLVPNDFAPQSEIVKFYKGSNILVTGASGFVGLILIEKLLRTCSEMSKVSVIVRPKKGVSPEERCKQLFQNVIFSRLKKERPNYAEKVRIISGDVGELNLGLSEEDQQQLMDTNVIFHMAASVRFDEKVRTLVNTNVRGTKELLRMARQMPNIQAFVYVSTAFSQCVYKSIEEKHYSPPIEADKLLTLLDIMPDEKLEQMVPALLGKWPNRYAMSKAVAENLVLQDSVGIPACIVRPSIIIPTAAEPITGWTNNMYGATGVIAGVAIGLIRVMYILFDAKAEMVPADYVVANLIAAAWETGRNAAALQGAPGNLDIPDIERVPVYNFVSSARNPVTWRLCMAYNAKYGVETPSEKVIWHYILFPTTNRFIYNILVFLLHTIPAVIVDTVAYFTGRTPILRKAYKKIHKFTDVLAFFTANEWRFSDNQVVKLLGKMSAVDKRLFSFDITQLEWEEYFSYHIKGLRVYLINDPLDTVEAGKRKYRQMQFAHYSLCTVLFLLFLWLTVTFLRFLWSFCPYSNY